MAVAGLGRGALVPIRAGTIPVELTDFAQMPCPNCRADFYASADEDVG